MVFLVPSLARDEAYNSHWIFRAGSRRASQAKFPDHPVGWVANRNTQNRQCSCGSPHPSPFPSGGNFFLFQRYVLITIRAGESQSPLCGTAQAAVPECVGGTLDFQLNEEQLHLKKSVREFAEREIKPNVMKWDEAGEFPLATIKELGKLGLLGMVFPPEYGGAGMGYVEYVTAIEELSRVDGSVGIIVAAHTSLCSNHIFLAGQRSAEKEIRQQTGDRRIHRRVGTDRAVVRIGRRQRAHDRRAQGK